MLLQALLMALMGVALIAGAVALTFKALLWRR